jgi:hypothetical protein
MVVFLPGSCLASTDSIDDAAVSAADFAAENAASC